VTRLIKEIADLIQRGDLALAKKALHVLCETKLPADSWVEVSQLARRVGLPSLGISLLRPVVRPGPRKPSRATSEQAAEYAACLIALGASVEGESLLKGVDRDKTPEANLYLSYFYISQWRYAEAIPTLERYIAAKTITSYQHRVGELNLLAAMVNEQWDESVVDRLDALSELAKKENHLRIFANTLELRAQREIFKGNWKKAEQALREAEKRLAASPTLDAFFIQKWKAVLLAAKSKEVRPLRDVRKEAWRRGHWETVRECDLFLAQATKNKSLALELYFGTPFEAYRARLLRMLSFPLTVPIEFDLSLGAKQAGAPRFDLRRGLWRKNRLSGQPLKLMTSLVSDLYRPSRVISLFSELYPGEFYNPSSSPDRVHQLIRRTRGWWKSHRVPLCLTEKLSSYRVVATGPFQLRVAAHRADSDRDSLRLEELRKACPDSGLSASMVARELAVSLITASRLLRKGVEENRLAKSGAGPATRYTFL